ncbi:NAD(P)H-dependent oxidoreductase [Fluviicola taffensis]|uniref:Nitroreductase n=1 Tax=Fluviicola taffensis (strain DSM 16823 / NCIMB 13979 / RW262) TaxID=755732 RepID=F2IGJ8_FLUTR|nr:NAD(P)H-dependent oxidoreductase [Fluviicola taffensis]AEA42604.1 nitroreductase [Fluviicola taffensis DSM 16823]
MKNALAWRYATQKYDPTKKISADDMTEILEAINSAPTSYGLQPFKLIHVKSPELRDQLRAASYDQSPVTDASDLVVFTVNRNIENQHIDSYMQRIVEVRDVERERLNRFQENIVGVLSTLNSAELVAWNAKQAYIGLGFGLVMAAHLGIDSTPMEGFNKERYDEILGLTDDHSILVLTFGYRSDEDHTQHHKKVRKTLDQLVTIK